MYTDMLCIRIVMCKYMLCIRICCIYGYVMYTDRICISIVMYMIG